MNSVPPQFGLNDFDGVCSTLNKETLLNKLLLRVTLSLRWTTNSFCSSTFSHWVLMSQKHWPAVLLVKPVPIHEAEQTLQGAFHKMSIQTSPCYRINPFYSPTENTEAVERQILWGESFGQLRQCFRLIRTVPEPAPVALAVVPVRIVPPSVHFLQSIPWFAQELILCCWNFLKQLFHHQEICI